MTTQETSPQWQTFIDLPNDEKPWMQIPSSDTANDTLLRGVLDAACYWVQDYIGRPIAPTTFFRRFSGWTGFNGAYLELPYYPVLSVTSVVEYRGSSGPYPLTEQTPANQGGADTYQLDPLRGIVIRTFTGLVQRPWFPGSRNVEIEWTAGYNPLPPTVRLAAEELVKYWWANTQQASRSFVPRGEYDQPDPATTALWPNVPHRITDLLDPFVQVGIG